VAKKVRLARPASAAPRATLKDRLIAGLVTARQNILDQLPALSLPQQDQVFLGEWSVKEILAHLIGWDHTYIAAVQDLQAAELPSFYAAYDADWQSYNRNLVHQYRVGEWSELLTAARRAHEQLVDYLRTLPDEEFGQDWGVRYGGTPVTIASLVEAEIKDEREHLRQIREWAAS
jgi:hypothetical protein